MHDMHQSVNSINARGAFASHMHMMHDLCMNLKHIRAARKMSQRELAALAGVDQSTIQRAETMHHTAKLDTYKLCAQVLGVTLEDIFAEDRDVAEIALVRAYRNADERGRRLLMKLAEEAAALPPEHDE
ncbi:helix-turn-helix transcriptional regulator [Falsigemmobacter faecalis]|nr:helix-turn-helix transcriptional regulator [Falsigemmobacter faecalis]